MACVHLQQLYNLCQEQRLQLGGSELIRVVCHQCGEQEVCPSVLVEEYDFKQSQQRTDQKQGQSTDSTSS